MAPKSHQKTNFTKNVFLFFHKGHSRRAGRFWQLYFFFFFPSNPLAPELPTSPPLTDGANEPLYAAASHCDTGTEVLLLVLSHSQNTSATASEVDNVCITTRA